MFGFDSRLRSCEISFHQNAIRSSALKADIKLSIKDKDTWVGIEIAFGPNNARVALLPVEEQPASAGARDGYPLVVEIEKLFELSVRSLRVLQEGSTWTLYCSGRLKPLIDQVAEGTTWPDLEFDEIGIRSAASGVNFVLPEGAGIAFSSPMVVEWTSVTLTISKFRIGRPQATRTELEGAIELQLSAEVEIIEGIPAGASVDGLVVVWAPTKGIVDTRLDGIGIEFGIPGSFSAGLQLSYSKDKGTSFKGKGHLDLESLDIRAEVGVAAGTEGSTRFFYLFADAELYPGGIPIGSTGLSLYGLQGLLAYNMGLNFRGVDKSTPPDRRYFALFNQTKVGLTDIDKWVVRKGAGAIGFGVVIGTADDGTVFSCRGMLIITLPDLDLILQSQTTIIEKRQGMSEVRRGALDTLLIYRTGDSTMTFDVRAEWTKEKIYSVSGTAHAVFKLNDPSAFQIQLGENSPGGRIGAKVVRWGDDWLFTSGFWLKIDSKSCAVGAVIDVGLRYQAGDFWAEASGSASADATLTWKPAQLDGKASLAGRIGIGCGGLGLSASLSGEPEIKVPTPLNFHVPIRACIHIDLVVDSFDLCLGFSFSWDKNNTPDPPSDPLVRITAVPRHWTPWEDKEREWEEIKDSGRIKGVERVLKNGVVEIVGDAVQRVPKNGVIVVDALVQPHSTLYFEFEKTMVDEIDVGRFNNYFKPEPQFLAIGRDRTNSVRYGLGALSLSKNNLNSNLFGIWTMSPNDRPNAPAREPNTCLALLSSSRFGLPGSLSGGGVEDTGIDHCKPVSGPTRHCQSLADVTFGSGTLAPCGWIYVWQEDLEPPPEPQRHSQYGVVFERRDEFTIFVPPDIDMVIARHAPFDFNKPSSCRPRRKPSPRHVCLPQTAISCSPMVRSLFRTAPGRIGRRIKLRWSFATRHTTRNSARGLRSHGQQRTVKRNGTSMPAIRFWYRTRSMYCTSRGAPSSG